MSMSYVPPCVKIPHQTAAGVTTARKVASRVVSGACRRDLVMPNCAKVCCTRPVAPHTNNRRPTVSACCMSSSIARAAVSSISSVSVRSRMVVSNRSRAGTILRSSPFAAPKAKLPSSMNMATVPWERRTRSFSSGDSSCLNSLLPSSVSEVTRLQLFIITSAVSLTYSTLMSDTPTATAAMRSTNTVISSTTAMTNTDSIGSWRARARYGRSSTSHPLFSSSPARHACGMCCAKRPRPATMHSSTTEWVAPDRGVRPPALTFTTVRTVAPAPATPPKAPDTILPTPWPTSSFSESWKSPVRLSATREVSRLSMPPSRASTRAEATMVGSSSTGKLGIRGTGNPAGICPKVNTFSLPK
mmetsp:Transcript_6218/g.17836  ORF Transcript_6218/g.17836 Transcript_6218/m.17836 type:complete len:358 (-) Transcript_6218:1010-2083(-)